jgi:general nucleoside transport system permease protein
VSLALVLALLQGVLTGAFRSGTSILYAALGEVIVERSGVINLGLEGCMLVGACAGFIVAVETGSSYVGLVAGGLAGSAFNLVLGYMVVSRRANQLASGLALQFLALGLTAIFGANYVQRRIDGLDTLHVPILADVPLVGQAIFQGDILTLGLIPVSVIVWWLLFRTRWGLALRTVGESRTVAFAAGLRPDWLQYQSLLVGGLLGGMGGAHLSLSYARVWIEGMTAGRGFIAVALVIFATWHPLRVILGALLFGGAIAFQLQLQARNAGVSPFLLDMLPYLLPLAVLLLARLWGSGKRQSQVPEGLFAVFEGTR